MDDIFLWLEKENIPYNDKVLINQALIHSSYVNENKNVEEDNERLEFVGDAVLQIWTAKKLYYNDTKLSEGKMTTLRAQLVCEHTLADYSRKLGWNKYIKLGIGEEKTGGRNRNSIIADGFEALLGAIYLDSGIDSVNKILEQVVTPYIKAPKGEQLIDFKTKLQEYIQSDSRKVVHYKVLKISGPSNKPNFEVGVYIDDILLGVGDGHSKKKAEQNAAKCAFTKMVK